MSSHIVTSRMPVIRYRLEPRALYISPPTVIANFTKERLSSSLERRYGPENLRRRLKLACGLAKIHRGMLIAKSLLRDLYNALGPYCTNCIGAKGSVFSDMVTIVEVVSYM